MNRLTIAILALAAVPAMAQPTTQPTPGDMITAQAKTINDLQQAWTGARAAYEASQRELITAQGKIATLEAKLPRQEPIPSPSGAEVNR